MRLLELGVVEPEENTIKLVLLFTIRRKLEPVVEHKCGRSVTHRIYIMNAPIFEKLKPDHCLRQNNTSFNKLFTSKQHLI